MTITRIRKWGNSYGLRIPKNIIDELALSPEMRLDIRHEQGQIIITPLNEPGINLDELVAQITPENRHGPIDWGEATGGEAW